VADDALKVLAAHQVELAQARSKDGECYLAA
jgi:hypothetical protein